MAEVRRLDERTQRGPRRWLWLRGRPGSSGLEPAKDVEYLAAAVARNKALRDRDEAVRAAAIPELAEIETLRAGVLTDLSRQLADALSLRVNQAIDKALAASYEREFSYLGSPRLAGQAGPASQADLASSAGQAAGEVNQEALLAVRAMIDGDFSGAVGVAGPRGIGKSTVLAWFATSVYGPVWSLGWTGMPVIQSQRMRRWGVCVAAPAQYDARDFLLHLFGRLCAEVLGEDRVSTLEAEMTGGKERPGRPPLPRGPSAPAGR